MNLEYLKDSSVRSSALLIARDQLAEAEDELARWEERAEDARRAIREIEEADLPTYDTEEAQHAT